MIKKIKINDETKKDAPPPLVKPLKKKLRLVKGRFGKEWLIGKIWFGVAKEKEIKELIKETREQEKAFLELETAYLKRLKKAHEKIPKVRQFNSLLFLKRLLGLSRERACLFDEQGFIVGIVSILPEDSTFKYKSKQYTIEREKVSTKLTLKRFLEKETFYFYNVNQTGAISLKNPLTSQYLTPEQLYTFMSTEQLKKLNSTEGLFGDLFNNPKKILIIVGIGIVAYILLSGGTAPPTP